MAESDINKYWNEIFDDYDIVNNINSHGTFIISSKQLKQYKEARLLTKFDCANQLPNIMLDNGINILPITRGNYLLGRFNCFEDLPKPVTEIKKVGFPEWIESIDVDDLFSEPVAISTALISPIFNDFFGDDGLISTVSGRMKSGIFDFTIDGHSVNIKNSQIELDASLESRENFVLIEAKNIIHNDFMVRQLYYPYRRFEQTISKPIHNVFMVYSNGIFRILEYKFNDLYKYDSIELIKEKRYSIDSTLITKADLENIVSITKINDTDYGAPFPQCDDFSKIISLCEQLSEKEEMTKDEIKELFGFVGRQSDYYFNGLKYLGFADSKKGKCFLLPSGKTLVGLTYKERQLKIVQAIIEKPIFNILLKIYLDTGVKPDSTCIRNTIVNLGILEKDSMIKRRASTVKSWIDWIIGLTN